MVIFSFIMMFSTLAMQGVFFWARDAVTRDLPTAFFASDVVWAVSLVSLIFYWRYPWITVASAWILFLTVAIALEPFSFGHTTSWFMERNGLALTNLVFAHIGMYSKLRLATTEADEARER